jgi:hypothetical protein
LGLKKRKVLNLKIKDVVDESERVVKQINIENRKMSVSSEVEMIIKGQIDHLKNNDNYNADRNSPLFQDKKGTEYSEAPRQLRKKINSPPLEKIRQNGLKEYYESLKNLSETECMKEMKNFTGLSDKEIKGIIKENIPKPGKKRAAYEKDSYMDEVIGRLQNYHDIDWTELMAIPEKISELDLDDLVIVERLINTYFDAVDKNVGLNKDAEGIDEEKKSTSKRILKEWLLEKLYEACIVFNPETKKAKKDSKSEESEEDRASMSVFEAITGKKPDTKIYKIPTDKNQMKSKTSEIQSDKEIFLKRMDPKFKVDIHILFDNCNLDPVKSYASQLLTMLIDQLPVEISDRKLPEKDREITQESFQILIGGKIKNISLQSTEKPFPNYNEMVNYLAREGYVCSLQKKLSNDQIYLIERDILLKIITITWNRFTENERINFYLGLLDNEHLKKFRQYLPFPSHWMNQFFNYTLFKELFGSSSPAFLKIAGLILNSTYFYHFNEDIPLKLDKTHKIWRDSFRDKIIKTIGKSPYGEAQMAMLGCISCICLLRQIEFLKDKGISFENTMAFQIYPSKIFF